MTVLQPPPRSGGPPPATAVAAPAARRLTVRAAKPLTPYLIVYAVEGWGKTSMGAHTEDPVILMARDETGYETLQSAGLVPNVPAERFDAWLDLLGFLDSLQIDTQGRKTVVLDAMGGFERLCHEHVCHTEFGDDWSDQGFLSYNKGYDRSASGEWPKLLKRLDDLNTLGMTVVLLGHAKVKPFKNPTGADFDRYVCDVHEKTWATTARGVDAVLFGNFLTVVDTAKREDRKSVAERKGKGTGGTARVLYTERRDAWDAKNRYGMAPQLYIDPDPSAIWSAVRAQIGKTKESE